MIYFLPGAVLKRTVREHTVRGAENPGAETWRSPERTDEQLND